jgi:hypothetical protein
MSRTYTPDLWSIVEIRDEKETYRRVLASWYGGFAGSDSWKISSAINEVVELPNAYEFHNESGSIYIAYKNSYGASSLALSVFHGMQQESGNMNMKLELLKEYTATSDGRLQAHNL